MHGVTYLLVMHSFVFDVFIFQCDVFLCLSLSWHGMVIHFVRELSAPSWCCALFVSYVMCTHDLWFMHGRDVLLFMWSICCLFCLLDIRFVDDHSFQYTCTLFDVFCTLTYILHFWGYYCSVFTLQTRNCNKHSPVHKHTIIKSNY